MKHVIIPLDAAYLEYRFFPRFNDWRDHWEFVRTVDYRNIPWC